MGIQGRRYAIRLNIIASKRQLQRHHSNVGLGMIQIAKD